MKLSDGTGYQNTDTSKMAAAAVSGAGGGGGKMLRFMVLDVLRAANRPISTQECADRVGRAYCSVQPRLSELLEAGLIRDSGERGKTQYGRSCILWEPVSRPAEV